MCYTFVFLSDTPETSACQVSLPGLWEMAIGSYRPLYENSFREKPEREETPA